MLVRNIIVDKNGKAAHRHSKRLVALNKNFKNTIVKNKYYSTANITYWDKVSFLAKVLPNKESLAKMVCH